MVRRKKKNKNRHETSRMKQGKRNLERNQRKAKDGEPEVREGRVGKTLPSETVQVTVVVLNAR